MFGHGGGVNIQFPAAILHVAPVRKKAIGKMACGEAFKKAVLWPQANFSN